MAPPVAGRVKYLASGATPGAPYGTPTAQAISSVWQVAQPMAQPMATLGAAGSLSDVPTTEICSPFGLVVGPKRRAVFWVYVLCCVVLCVLFWCVLFSVVLFVVLHCVVVCSSVSVVVIVMHVMFVC